MPALPDPPSTRPTAHPATSGDTDGLVLSQRAAKALADGVPDSTRRAYTGDWQRFTTWCAHHGHEWATGPRALAALLVEYTTHLAYDRRLKPATINRALAGIAKYYRTAQATAPDLSPARQVIKGYTQALAASPDSADRRLSRPRRAAAATPDKLRRMTAALDPATPAGKRDTAVLLLAFATAARRSELAALNTDDITEDEAGRGLEVAMNRRKTGTRHHVAVLYGSHPRTCPVRAWRAWYEVLTEHGLAGGPAFVRIDRHGRLAPRVRRNGRLIGDPQGRLTGEAVAEIVARAAKNAGLNPPPGPGIPAPQWSGHSLRRGYATAARTAGQDRLTTGRHGGWADGSSALNAYFDDGDRWDDNPLTGIGL
ncbi:tyrosine-type recombinase/integrase [Nocardiopsis sp. CNT-189]|uniref:tyrosine-type recombinase/integrase n=1 Tax=Nocardiopsis oceanisediminis TaxID=2816862 RepID=UPI003B2945A5